jgi:hypothetical protein
MNEDTTHTKGHTEPSEKLKGGQLLETISLRDYFAAKAMQGIVGRDISDFKWISTYAEKAYKMADAMLEARK